MNDELMIPRNFITFAQSQKPAGRRGLYSTLAPAEFTAESVYQDAEKQKAKAWENWREERALWNYVRNYQPIISRSDDSEGASANNRIVVNFAIAISRNLSAYTFPKGINYLSRKQDENHVVFVDMVNRMMMLKSNNIAAQEMKWYQSVCGHAYLYANKDPDNIHDVPFVVEAIEPWRAYVVYSAFSKYKPLYGVIETEKYTQIWTDNEYWVYNGGVLINGGVNALGVVPVIEVPNNSMRTGDFEIALSLLDGINTVASDSVNNIEDVVKSYMVLLGVDKDEAKELDFSQGSVLALGGQPGINQSATFIHPTLDGTTVQQLRSYMESALKFVTGVPDRDSESTASTTGAAEDIKTGQSDKDAIANEKCIYVEEAQRRVLEIVLKILSAEMPDKIPEGITAADIDVDITRANRDNMLVKSQSLLNFKQFGLSPEDALYLANVTNDAPGMVRRMVDTDEAASEDELILRSISQSQMTGGVDDEPSGDGTSD